MSRRNISFNASPTVFVINHQRDSSYNMTIQNNTGAVLTPTYTNQNVQEPTPSFTAGDGTNLPITIPDTEFICIRCPIEAISFAGTPGGTIDIVEAG